MPTHSKRLGPQVVGEAGGDPWWPRLFRMLAATNRHADPPVQFDEAPSGVELVGTDWGTRARTDRGGKKPIGVAVDSSGAGERNVNSPTRRDRAIHLSGPLRLPISRPYVKPHDPSGSPHPPLSNTQHCQAFHPRTSRGLSETVMLPPRSGHAVTTNHFDPPGVCLEINSNKCLLANTCCCV